jgi:hypothetical protein
MIPTAIIQVLERLKHATPATRIFRPKVFAALPIKQVQQTLVIFGDKVDGPGQILIASEDRPLRPVSCQTRQGLREGDKQSHFC